jgi:hypothetical protein
MILNLKREPVRSVHADETLNQRGRTNVFTNGLIGMAVAAIGAFFMLWLCASETKENVDAALAKELEDAHQ